MLNITLKTLANKRYIVDVEDNITVGQLKSRIQEIHKIEVLNLSFDRKILNDDKQKLNEIPLPNECQLVLFVGKRPVRSSELTSTPSSSSSSSSPSTTSFSSSSSPSTTSFSSSSSPSTTSFSSSSSPSTASFPTSSTRQQFQNTNFPDPNLLSSHGFVMDETKIGWNSEPITEEKIQNLVAMGFERPFATQCLKAAYGNETIATEYCLNGLPSVDEQSLIIHNVGLPSSSSSSSSSTSLSTYNSPYSQLGLSSAFPLGGMPNEPLNKIILDRLRKMQFNAAERADIERLAVDGVPPMWRLMHRTDFHQITIEFVLRYPALESLVRFNSAEFFSIILNRPVFNDQEASRWNKICDRVAGAMGLGWMKRTAGSERTVLEEEKNPSEEREGEEEGWGKENHENDALEGMIQSYNPTSGPQYFSDIDGHMYEVAPLRSIIPPADLPAVQQIVAATGKDLLEAYQMYQAFDRNVDVTIANLMMDEEDDDETG